MNAIVVLERFFGSLYSNIDHLETIQISPVWQLARRGFTNSQKVNMTIEEYVATILADAPPLDKERRERLALLFS